VTPAGIRSTTEPPSVGIGAAADSIPGSLTVSVSPSSLQKTDTAASITTATATVTATGGTAPYTYAWTRISGSTLISANSPAAAASTFTGSTLVSGTTYDATFRCTVTDSAGTPAVKTIDVAVSIRRESMLASASPATLYKTGDSGTITSNSTTVTPSGGTSPYSYSWTKQGGDTLTVTSPTAATTTFSTSGLSEGEFAAATYRCTVTDSTTPTALTATADVSITLENPAEGAPP
jgi:hypothetical protein